MNDTITLVLAPAAALLLVLFYINLRMASPLLAIPIRWMRWILFALFAAETNERLNLIDRQFWVVAAAAFLLWFLVESGFNWLRVSAISLSPLPLFPKFVANTSGDEWPTHRRLLKVRDWLRAQGFVAVQALKAEVGGGIWLRVSVYHNRDRTMRLQVAFLPQDTGAITVCYSLSTEAESGRRYITDNFFLPFGGFYPENWLVDRNPWRRSLAEMVAAHSRRVVAADEKPVAWDSDPLNDLNRQQLLMDQLNTELGFLLPLSDREEHGKITPEGRFRIWKEAWLLDYFGRAARYF
ncbi:MAG TPA: hypothetical protein VGM73_07015 [Candidatus Didemnitutus sp.]|jgi:hypothetical protein